MFGLCLPYRPAIYDATRNVEKKDAVRRAHHRRSANGSGAGWRIGERLCDLQQEYEIIPATRMRRSNATAYHCSSAGVGVRQPQPRSREAARTPWRLSALASAAMDLLRRRSRVYFTNVHRIGSDGFWDGFLGVSVDDHSTQYSTRVDGLDFWNEHCNLRLVCEPTDKLACTKLPSTKLQVPSTNMPLIVLMCKLA